MINILLSINKSISEIEFDIIPILFLFVRNLSIIYLCRRIEILNNIYRKVEGPSLLSSYNVYIQYIVYCIQMYNK